MNKQATMDRCFPVGPKSIAEPRGVLAPALGAAEAQGRPPRRKVALLTLDLGSAELLAGDAEQRRRAAKLLGEVADAERDVVRWPE